MAKKKKKITIEPYAYIQTMTAKMLKMKSA